MLLSDAVPCGAVNQRRLVALHCDKSSGFETIHGLLNRVMEALRVPLAGALAPPEQAAAREAFGGGYEWRAEDDAPFFPGRHAGGGRAGGEGGERWRRGG